MREIASYLAIVCLLLAVGFAWCQQTGTQNLSHPDASWKMVNEHWATFKIEGYRQSWGRPANVTKMVLYEPGAYLPSEKTYALYWWAGNQENRADFDSRENALKLVEFIIENSKAGEK